MSDSLENPKESSLVAEFLEWVRKNNGERILYRGLPCEDYEIESAMLRRMKSKDVNQDSFISANRHLIERAKIKGHNIKDGHKMKDLEIMAELQHYGAATCLIDFTVNPLIALWFACTDHFDKTATGEKGQVVAMDTPRSEVIDIEFDDIIEKKIKDFLSEEKKPPHAGKMIRIWKPKHQNNRIVAQQSVFVFGPAKIENNTMPPYIVEIKDKSRILDELRAYGISVESLFPDFDGFARILNAHDQPYPHSKKDYYHIGNEASRNGNYALAIKFYDMALLPPSPYKEAFIERGMAHFYLDNWEEAISDYDDAIRVEPKDVRAYTARAYAKHKKGLYKPAIADYNKAVSMMTSEDPNIYLLRGQFKADLGKHHDAINDYNEAIKINPQYADAYHNRGIAKARLGEHRNAINNYNEAIKINPQYADAYHNRGIAKAKLDEHLNAIADFNKAIKINPQYAIAFNNRGTTKTRLNKYHDAIADYNEAIKINPQYAIAFNNRGITKAELGKYHDAIADYNEAIKINPQYAIAYHSRGNAKLQTGDKKSAMKDFQKANKIDPDMKIPDIE